MCLSAEWRVLREHFNLLCNTLPYNYQLTIDKLRNIVQIIKDDGEQLSKLMTSSSNDFRKINENIIAYLIVKSCYNGSGTSLVRLCDVMVELVGATDIPTCIQQIRHGMYIKYTIIYWLIAMVFIVVVFIVATFR